MIHTFDVDIARLVGLNAAVIFQNILFWCLYSQANKINYYDGNYWTFNSVKAMAALFPYFSSRQIETAIRKLIDAGLIIKGNYNRNPYDRTCWYAIINLDKYISQQREIEQAVRANVNTQDVEPIPDINTDINTNIITDIKRASSKRFIKPTKQELEAYAREIDFMLDAEAFLDFYETKGWMVGRDKMKDWKAAVRTWKRRAKERGEYRHAVSKPDTEPELSPEQLAIIDEINANGWNYG